MEQERKDMDRIKINGKTRTCGLIGNPVEHTLSPVIHNTLAQMTGKNMVYVPLLVEGKQLENAIKGAYALNLMGMNVTVPYKSDVIDYLLSVDCLAEKIGAVNTLVRTDGGYRGYNTDMTGLLRAMQTEHICIKDETVLLLGAGGAARAVAFLCVSEGAKKVYLCNRTGEKALQVAKEVNTAFEKECILPITYSELETITEDRLLAIQATSVGLYPNAEDTPLADGAIYQKIHTGVDLIYRPSETMFMKLVKKHGGKTMNGLKMLLYQGIIAFELWNDVSITETQANEILLKMKEEMANNE